MLINQTAQCHVYTIDAPFECTFIIRSSSFIGLNGLEREQRTKQGRIEMKQERERERERERDHSTL